MAIVANPIPIQIQYVVGSFSFLYILINLDIAYINEDVNIAVAAVNDKLIECLFFKVANSVFTPNTNSIKPRTNITIQSGSKS